MEALQNRVIEWVERHALFPAGARVGVAVSGGPDSVCLLHLLREIGERWGLQLSVLHVDHQLRPAAAADGRFVEELARDAHLEFRLERVVIEGSVEQAARNARLAFFHRLLREGVVDRVATGHTLSDQAETVLMRLLRGAGTAGLSGILPATREGVVRPLLAVHRSEAEAWLRERGLAWRVDESNASREFLRNRIRLDLMPELRASYNPRAELILAQTAELARDEERYWQTLVDRHATAPGPGPAVTLEIGELRRHPKALGRRLVRHAIEAVKGDLRQIEFEHVEAILRICETSEGSGRVILPGVDVMRSFDWLRLRAPGVDGIEERLGHTVALNVPGDTHLPIGDGIIRTRLGTVPAGTEESGYNKGQRDSDRWARVDWDKLEGTLALRFWLPGDQYHALGRQGAEKLKQMFQMARVPLWERRFWPIIESSDGIVWARRFGPSARYQESSTTRQVLEISEIA